MGMNLTVRACMTSALGRLAGCARKVRSAGGDVYYGAPLSPVPVLIPPPPSPSGIPSLPRGT